MQVTFNTDSPTDVAFVRQILGIVAPVPAPPAIPAQSGKAIPDNAPTGARWVPMPGVPILVDVDGDPLPVDWSDPKNPVVVPTTQGGGGPGEEQ